jgi:miniconductance mechanosensitive channel
MHKLVEKIFGWGYHLFKKWDFGETLSAYLSLAINIIVLAFLSYLIFLVFRFVLVRTLIIMARKTKSRFDDLLVSNKTAKYIAHLIPLLFISFSTLDANSLEN